MPVIWPKRTPSCLHIWKALAEMAAVDEKETWAVNTL